MKKIIILFIFSILLFSNTRNNTHAYKFPNAFMEDNDLVYDPDDTTKMIMKEKEEENPEEKEKEILYVNIMNAEKYETNEQPILEMPSNKYLYIAPAFSMRKGLNLVGIGAGFIMNDWIGIEFLLEQSIQDNNVSLITNEFSLNVLDKEMIRANILASFSAGSNLDTSTGLDNFFYTYGVGGEIEFVVDRVKITGGYKAESRKIRRAKALNSNVFFVKIKFNFSF